MGINSSYYTDFIKNGIRTEDKIKVFPLSGRFQEIPVLFNNLVFESGDSYKKNNEVVTLPSFKDQTFRYFLEKKESGRFLFRSNNIYSPFKINGQFATEAWVLRGDKIEFNYNSIEFLEKNKINENENFYEFLPKKEILKSKLNILIQGETGTGKTTLAEMIHSKSSLVGNFVHLNLEAFSPQLIESELFGHVKGAFTGANYNKNGAIMMANNGTLFLDEVDSLSLNIQCKLLLFLDKKYFYPVGSDIKKKSNVRLIFASATPLKKLLDTGRIRKDFYFRIASGETIQIPPLRNNPQIISKICKELENDYDIIISKNLIKFYSNLTWPGNIRQLKQHIYKKSLLSQNKMVNFDNYDEKLVQDALVDEIFGPELLDMKSYQYIIATKIYQKFECHLKNSAKMLKVAPQTLKGILESKPLNNLIC